MKYNLFTVLLSLLALLTLGACHKDNGNYNYHSLNEISISSTADTVYVNQFDTLTVNPSVSQIKPDTGVLTYSWYYFSVDVTNPLPTQYISNQRILHAQIGAAPGHYSLYLKVTDTTTGTSEFHAFSLITTTSIAEGWLAMYDVSPDSCDAAIILTTGKTLYNLYSNANLHHMAGSSRSIVNFTAGWHKQYIYCLTDQEGDYISPLDFTRQKSFDSAFYGTPPARNYQAILPNPGADFLEDYLINDAKVYTRLWAGPFSVPSYGAALAGDYQAAPYVLGTPYFNFGPYPAVIYDESHHKFQYVPLNTSSFVPFPDNDTAAFNLNNMGDKTMRFGYNSSTGQATAVFKNNANDTCFVYTMDFTQTSPALTVKTVALAGSPLMSSATLFDISPTLPMIYYANGSNVYKYDMQANVSTLLYTFPAPITALRMLNPERPDSYQPVNLGKRLVVATYDGATGSVYEFSITPTGAFASNTYLNLYTGFGKINSLYYKLQL